MKKHFRTMFLQRALFVLGLSLVSQLFAQNVGINTDGSAPDNSAMLDIKATDRGLLIPRVSLTNVTVAAPVTAPATGLLVFNTNASVVGGNGTGFYYWTGTQWSKLESSVTPAWLLSGNNGTNPTTNFLGTTDAQPLVIRTNNTERVRVTSGGNVGIGTTNPTERLHVAGNLRLDNAFMPGNNAGTAGSLLRSDGAGNPPVWIAPGANGSVLTMSGGLPTWSSPNGLFWGLTGNSGTNPSTNFLGTTDAVDLVIRTNNNERVRVTSSGNVGIGISNPTQRVVVNGNIGLQASNNAFVGTLDNWPLILSSNNTERLRFNTNNSIQRDAGGAGRGNHAIDLQAVRNNTNQVASGPSSALVGGENNRAAGAASGVFCGYNNSALSTQSVVIGGGNCTLTNGTLIAGCASCNMNSARGTIVGGFTHTMTDGIDNFIGGGNEHTILQSVNASILGGFMNRIEGTNTPLKICLNSSIIGGRNNTVTDTLSTIIGADGLKLGKRSIGMGFKHNWLFPSQLDFSSFSNIAVLANIDLWLYNTGNTARALRLYEPTTSINGNANYTAFRAQSQNVDITYTLPASLTPSNTLATGLLQTDGNGNLSWLNPAVLTGAANAWQITGNAGTSASTHFLGTTDNVDLVFRTNNLERMRIRNSGNVGIGLTNPTERLVVNGNIGLQAGAPAFVGTLDNNRLELRVNNQTSLTLNPPGTSAPAWSMQRDLGGNTRGLYAVDLQVLRSNNNQVASGNYSVLLGGQYNRSSGYSAVLVGGEANNALSTYSALVGGYYNNISSAAGSSFLGGGYQNGINGYPFPQHEGSFSVLCGGSGNWVAADYGVICGGGGDPAWGDGNTVMDTYGAIVGGSQNYVGTNNNDPLDAGFSAILGGFNNIVLGYSSVIVGGRQNRNYARYGFLGGGGPSDPGNVLNQVTDDYGFVGGGGGNVAGNGQTSTTDARYAAVVGGRRNTASGSASAILGGTENTASGSFSAVAGGRENTANASYNFVFGEDVDPNVTETHRVYLFGDGSTSPSRPSGFLVINRLDGDHPIHIGTNNTNGNGAHLTTGGTWTNASTREKKDRFRLLDAADVLGKIRQLPVEGWYYKGTEEYHIGPYAEDFYAAFGTGVHQIIETDSTGTLVRRPNPEVSRYLAASDVAGVALLGVKAVDSKTEALENRQATLEDRQSAMESRLEALIQEVERLKAENLLLKTQLNQLQASGTVGEK